MHIDEEGTALNGTGSLPVRLESSKPLPSLPSAPTHSPSRRRDAAPMRPSRGITNELAAVAATSGYDLSYIMDATPATPVMSNADREQSPQSSNLDSAQFLQQAVLDLQTEDIAPWDVVRPSSVIGDAFARHVIENDVVYKTQYGAWTFKRNTNIVLKSSRSARTSPPPQSEPSISTAQESSDKGKGKSPEPQPRQATEGQLWECRLVGKYALSPGRTRKPLL
jgi:hypothetical protein